MVRACIEKRRKIRRQRVMGMEVLGKKGEEDRSGDGWITSRTTCRRELSGEEAQDRVQWRCLIINIDQTYKWERMRKKKKIIVLYHT